MTHLPSVVLSGHGDACSVEVPPLREGEVHLWEADLQSEFLEGAHLLSEDESRRATEMTDSASQRRFIAARVFLRCFLGTYLEEDPASLTFTYSPQGRPLLPASPHLHFSLARTLDTVLLGVSLHPLGVDMEPHSRADQALAVARRFLSVDERKDLSLLSPRERSSAALRAWVRKEAWLKARGEGVFRGMTDLSVWIGEEVVPVTDDTDSPWSIIDVSAVAGGVIAVAVACHTPVVVGPQVQI